ncbi:hypothetical protein KSP39_PZI009550 [Platanthera zijinensis]|uniref:Polyprotein n=1 Tax=Platanthera zijinensis TaxID=2320716 RepID=A0AAP0G7Z0_9ASPA
MVSEVFLANAASSSSPSFLSTWITHLPPRLYQSAPISCLFFISNSLVTIISVGRCSLKLSSNLKDTWGSSTASIHALHYLSLPQHPPTTTNIARDVWLRKDQLILSWLVASLTDPLISLVVGFPTSKVVWYALAKAFASHSRVRVLQLKTNLHNIKRGSSIITEYIQQIKTITDNLAIIGHQISDSDLVMQVLAGLGPTYDSFVPSITTRLDDVSLEDLHGMLLAHESLHQYHEKTVDDIVFPSVNMATSTRGFSDRGGRGGRGFRGRGRGRGRGPPRCQICMETGHFGKGCPQRFNHTFFGGPRSSQYPSGPPSRYPSSVVAPPSALSVAHPQYPVDEFSSLHLGTTSSPWYPDSGATHHITPDYSQLSGVEPYKGTDSVRIGNGTGLPILHHDHLHFPSHLHRFKLSNVLHDPVSGKVLLHGHLKDGLYQLSTSTKPAPCSALLGERATVSSWHARFGHPAFQTMSQILSKFGLPTFVSSGTTNATVSALRPGRHSSATCSPPPRTRSLTDLYAATTPLLAQTNPHRLLAALLAATSPEPTCYTQAVRDPAWRAAMSSEFNALLRNGTWTLVPCQPHFNLIGCKWVFKLKQRSDGSIERHKARLVAKGFKQQPGIDCFDTFIPVIKITTVRLFLSLAVSSSWPIQQLDVSNAFLHGHLSETVYMEQPPGFSHPQYPDHVCLLRRSLYSLCQAPRAWFHRLSTYLLNLHFTASKTDTSLFFKNNNSRMIFVLIYVDDILVTGSDFGGVAALVSSLHTEFSIRDLGHARYFLGIELCPHPAGCLLSQIKYIVDILQRSKMSDARPISTPMATPSLVDATTSTPLSDPTLYRSIVGALQYVQIMRPDISFVVNRAFSICMLRLIIIGPCDADWVSSSCDHRSTGGYAIFLGRNLVSWSSKKQPTVARSSTEAEYKAVANATAELVWLQSLLQEINLSIPPPILWCDNIGATYLSANPVFHARTKHIEIDFHFVRERVDAKLLQVSYISTHDQCADIFTKPLSRQRFLELRLKLNIAPPLSSLRGRDNTQVNAAINALPKALNGHLPAISYDALTKNTKGCTT